ncbi:MAG TPA: 50S ribosomal protein L25/general stress protein Ctc [Candidatus Competibacter phosphatis]|nr:50S ribosomal protein L25/general stress protein Ctc [Candidatus Competibacter phosphatis]HMR02917.1 50S ribosomal protein L25/general stress protein Ctc [Candidatus Competibacter phosphatis]
MSTTFELRADPRGTLGKGASRRLRRAGKVPAILYGGGQDPMPLLLDQLDLMNQFKNEAIYSHVLTLNLGDRTEQAVLRDVQRHPFKSTFLHLDFLRVIADRKLRAHVPLHFANETTARGVKLQGGVINRSLIEIEIECLPGDLPEFIEIDLANLGLGDTIHLSEIELPANVVLASHVDPGSETDAIVVSIQHAHGGGEEEAAGGEPAAG